ncbi:MAG: hypothetical protein QOK06_1166, partial [Acidimicrobiaceae bacterium]
MKSGARLSDRVRRMKVDGGITFDLANAAHAARE